MRCINVEFHGYKRLADTSCNTDGKMIAFLGPNEAGKSSVLNGLTWLSYGEDALPERFRTRSKAADSEKAVVRARFALNDQDRALLDDMPLVGKPDRFVIARYPDGTQRTGLQPELRRDPAPFEAAHDALTRVEQRYPDDFRPAIVDADTDEVEIPDALPWRDAVVKSLADHEAQWKSTYDDEFDEFCNWLRAPAEDEELRDDEGELLPRDGDAANLLETAREVLRADHPSHAARQRMLEHAPQFALFDDADRSLESRYDLADPYVRVDPPKALANLLAVAELDIEQLWTHIEGEDIGRTRTQERRANERLRARLGPKWRQENIEVELRTNGTGLEVLIVETSDEGADTPIGERSDGLRIFVALVAFLARKNFDVPPILLVDEAETHLHYDAQADLVEVLATDVEATQVFYTTHSPGCLPRDLGTGVRFVAPIPGRRDASELRNDFWTNERPGFTPLLFAMGAGAAAFSAFRRAVLTEGAADMILLPSLLRLATGEADLSYQVAPGLANYHGSGLELEETAARVVYLVDGDPGGTKNKNDLVGLRIEEDRIFQFATNKAPEDYVDPDRYLAVINSLVAPNDEDPKVNLADLDSSVPISKAVGDWCRARDIKPPGKTVVASILVNNKATLRLAPGADEELTRLHTRMTAALTASPSPR